MLTHSSLEGKDIVNLQDLVKQELDNKTFGKYLSSRREELGMSVRAFAKELGMTPAYLCDIEKGNRYAPTKYLEKMRLLLNLTSSSDVQAFEDLASATRDFLYEDINPYLGKRYLARIALRKAQELDAKNPELSEEIWKEFIEKLDQESELLDLPK